MFPKRPTCECAEMHWTGRRMPFRYNESDNLSMIKICLQSVVLLLAVVLSQDVGAQGVYGDVSLQRRRFIEEYDRRAQAVIDKQNLIKKNDKEMTRLATKAAENKPSIEGQEETTPNTFSDPKADEGTAIDAAPVGCRSEAPAVLLQSKRRCRAVVRMAHASWPSGVAAEDQRAFVCAGGGRHSLQRGDG